MKDIDWSKAPEGATHWVGSKGFTVLSPWEKHTNGNRYIWSDHSGDWNKSSMSRLENFDLIVDRPTQWKGPQDGFPPEGTECLVTHNGIIGWRRITVLTGIFDTPEEGCHRKTIVVYYHDTCKTGLLHNVADDDTQFRPIQSELDKFLNYAHNLVDKKLISSNASADGSFSLESIIKVLYDAGILVDPERKPAEKMTHGEAWRALNDVLNDRRISMAMSSRDMIIEALAKGVEL